MKKLLRTTAIIGSAQILVILIQIIRAKIVALIIGPEGIGIIGNTLAFVGVLENICFLGIHIALLRYSSEEANKKRFLEISKLFSTTIFIHIIVSFLGIIISIFFLQKINLSIYQNLIYLPISLFAILSVPFLMLKADFNYIFNAFNKVKLLGKITIISSIVNLTITVPLIFLWGLKGAIFSIFANALITFFVSIYFYKFYDNGYFYNKIKIKKSLFSKKESLKMFKYGGANQLAILINSFSGYILRIFVTGKLLLEGAGIFNASMRFGSYLLMLQGPLGIYLYPKISSIYKNKQETKKEINDTLRFFLIIIPPIIVCFLLFSDIAIKLLLTNAFMAVRVMLVWIFIAKFFEILQSIMALPLFVMEKFKTYLTVITIFNATLIILSYILLDKFNLIGLAIAIFISHALLFVFWLIASYKVFYFKINKANTIMLITSLFLIFLANYLSNYNFIFKFSGLIITLIWLLMVVKKNEWNALNKYMAEKILIKLKK